jgi:hypothetical protein
MMVIVTENLETFQKKVWHQSDGMAQKLQAHRTSLKSNS